MPSDSYVGNLTDNPILDLMLDTLVQRGHDIGRVEGAIQRWYEDEDAEMKFYGEYIGPAIDALEAQLGLLNREEAMTIDELAKAAGLRSYDPTKPQPWLNATASAARVLGFADAYEILRTGTVWCYDDTSAFGKPVALTDEARLVLAALAAQGEAP
jgi:hypothetical protein